MPIRSRRSRASASSSSRVSSVSPSRRCPDVACSSPASTISRLVLPDPDGPTMPSTSPCPISRSMPRRMLTGPAAAGTVRVRFRTWTSAGSSIAARRRGPRGSDGIHGRTICPTAPARWKPHLVLAFLFFTHRRHIPPRSRLLVLGDSLTAGYGLSHTEDFQAQLAAALRARRPRGDPRSMAPSPATPPPAAAPGSTGRSTAAYPAGGRRRDRRARRQRRPARR